MQMQCTSAYGRRCFFTTPPASRRACASNVQTRRLFHFRCRPPRGDDDSHASTLRESQGYFRLRPFAFHFFISGVAPPPLRPRCSHDDGHYRWPAASLLADYILSSPAEEGFFLASPSSFKSLALIGSRSRHARRSKMRYDYDSLHFPA